MSMKHLPTIHLSEFLQRRSNGGWKSAKENFIHRFKRWLSICYRYQQCRPSPSECSPALGERSLGIERGLVRQIIERTECLKSWLRSNITSGLGIIHEETMEMIRVI
ncbi:hypothetical protein LIPSTDRAFT_334923 [Lipomyces starkeyi NRRL Y-11557]|uniref:Uncharacterized protein n=1 Tax=Lipomyces starkeyi NRRL Y-11557 TaxID=675824 RepID=A0A1E3PUJ9_LIPST|nr:hypothetical protein LIPSTDRAFT_334923 [Lipomyces starkeyi NRRL Y-11557]